MPHLSRRVPLVLVASSALALAGGCKHRTFNDAAAKSTAPAPSGHELTLESLSVGKETFKRMKTIAWTGATSYFLHPVAEIERGLPGWFCWGHPAYRSKHIRSQVSVGLTQDYPPDIDKNPLASKFAVVLNENNGDKVSPAEKLDAYLLAKGEQGPKGGHFLGSVNKLGSAAGSMEFLPSYHFQPIAHKFPMFGQLCDGWATASINYPEPSAFTTEGSYEYFDSMTIGAVVGKLPQMPVKSVDTKVLLSYYDQFLNSKPRKSLVGGGGTGMTPAAFHRAVAARLGQEKGFVLTLFSNDHLRWDRPVVAYRMKAVESPGGASRAGKRIRVGMFLYWREPLGLVEATVDEETAISCRGYAYDLTFDASGKISGEGEWVEPDLKNLEEGTFKAMCKTYFDARDHAVGDVTLPKAMAVAKTPVDIWIREPGDFSEAKGFAEFVKLSGVGTDSGAAAPSQSP